MVKAPGGKCLAWNLRDNPRRDSGGMTNRSGQRLQVVSGPRKRIRQGVVQK